MTKVADRLASEYAGRVPDRVVRELVSNAYRPFRSALVTPPACAFGGRLPEPAGDVVLGALLRRVGEDLLRGVGFDEIAGLAGTTQGEERGGVGDARSLLHVVRDDDDGVAILELED